MTTLASYGRAAIMAGHAEEAASPVSPKAPQMPAGQICPECGAVVPPDPAIARRLFCTRAHQQRFNQRWRRRGGQVAPFAMAARLTRDGTRGDRETGKKAVRIVSQLFARYAEEDAAAGRMDMVAYAAARCHYGWEPV